MENSTKYKIAAGLFTVLLGTQVCFSIRTRKRDEKAALFYSELERKISPSSATLQESEAFDINYYQTLMKTLKKSYYLLKMAAADGYAKDIADSWGWLDDNEEKIYGVFRALKDKVQVSQVAHRYFLKTKINLIDDLTVRLHKDELKEVNRIVEKLPAYRVAESTKPAKG